MFIGNLCDRRHYTIEVTLDFSALALFRKIILILSLSLLVSILYNCVLLYDYVVGVLCSLSVHKPGLLASLLWVLL